MNKMKSMLVFVSGIAVVGCGGGSSTQSSSTTATAAAVHEMTVEEVAAGIGAGSLHVYDANREETFRAAHVPGAVWVGHELSASVLPADHAASLVFYCANEQCGASHQVASMATEAGYSNVSVMPAGIAGWQSAGQPVEAAPAAPAAQ